MHVPLRPTESVWFSRVPCSPKEAVWCWCELENIVHAAQLVCKLSKLCTPGTAYISILCPRSWCATRFHPVTSSVLVGYGPTSKKLQSLSIGASVNMYAGSFLHADDIPTLATNASSLEAQISTVTNFADENFLRLNALKCEIIVFTKSFTKCNLEVGGNSLSVGCEAMCLGYRWR